MGLLDGDIKNIVASATADLLLDFKVRRISGGTYDPATGTETPKTSTDYSCKGVVLNYSDRLVSEGAVTMANRKVLISAGSLSIEPTTEDKVVDNNGKLWPILDVKKDPAGATWTLKSEA